MSSLVRPYVPAIDDEAAADLRARLDRVRWPEAQPATDGSQGIALMTLQRLVDRWTTGYSFDRLVRRLTSQPQVVVDIGGLPLHAVYRRSTRPDAVPLVLGHGWPSTCFEFLDVIDDLTEPTDGGQAFHVVCPSLPGYGFSGKPAGPGWGVARTADAWVELMTVLGHGRFIAHGGDWGAIVATELAVRHPERLLGLHLVMPLAASVGSDLDAASPAERAGADREAAYRQRGSAYALTQSTRPQTVGYALVDSPVALAAWIGEKLLEWSGRDDTGASLLDDDAVLDVVSIYWFTATGASAARFYNQARCDVPERTRGAATNPRPTFGEAERSAAGDLSTTVDVPTACSIYPDEIVRPPRAAVARRYRDLRAFRERPRGGHFPAAEVPGDFVAEVRASADLLLRPPG